MIANNTELAVSLEYARKWADVLKAIELWGKNESASSPSAELMACQMSGPLGELRKVLDEATDYLEAHRMTTESLVA